MRGEKEMKFKNIVLTIAVALVTVAIVYVVKN